MRNPFPDTYPFWALTFACMFALFLVLQAARTQQRVSIPYPVIARPQLVFVRRIRAYRYAFWQHPYTDQDGKHEGDSDCWVADITQDIPEPFKNTKPRTMFAEFNYVNTEDGWSLDPNKSYGMLGLSAGYRILRDDDFEPVLWTKEMPHTGKCKQGGSQ